MILSSVRIAKSQKAYSSLIHNILSTKNKINDLQNIMYEVNSRGQIRQEKFIRDNNNSNMYKQQTEKLKNDIEKIKKDYQEHSYKGLKLRKDAHLFKEGVITFGDTKNEDYDKKIRELSQKEDFNRDVINGIREVLKEFGIEGNITIFQHNDETSVHYHFDYLSYNFDTHKVINKEYSPRMLSKIQDTFSKSIEKHDIHRGIKKVDRIREYIEKNNINYEKMTREEQIEVIKKVNVENRSLKKHNQELTKNNKKLQQEIETLQQEKNKLKEEIKGIIKEGQGLKSKLTYMRGEIQKLEISVEKKKKLYEDIDKQQRETQTKITDMKKMLKEYTSYDLSPKSIEEIINKNSSMFTKNYENISVILNDIQKRGNSKNNKGIVEEKNKIEEEKEYYKNENDKKRLVIGQNEGKIEELEKKNKDLDKQNKDMKWKLLGSEKKIEFYNSFTPEEIKEIEEYRKSQKNDNQKRSFKM